MNDAKHPIWAIIRLAILMVSMVIALWLNATHFDKTEMRSIITVFLAAAGAEGVGQFFTRKQ